MKRSLGAGVRWQYRDCATTWTIRGQISGRTRQFIFSTTSDRL